MRDEEEVEEEEEEVVNWATVGWDSKWGSSQGSFRHFE
jgi:hypothetical protein